jgi:NADH:ubiquinone oxidoreductase subunit F (NADH-binding)
VTQLAESEERMTIETPFGVNRLFAAGSRANYRNHVATYGALSVATVRSGLVAELDRSGLLGRGGAGFPAAQKFGALPSRAGMSRVWQPSAVVIANGAEGEPRSLKDETLLREAPHLVIDGLLAAAAAVHASTMYLYTTAHSIEFIRRAIAERADARTIHLVEAPDTFISGEASAVVNAIGTGKALPTDRTVRLTTSGLKQRPTLVHNVETLAHVALIARYGSEWFRGVGSNRDPGTRLVTVSGAVRGDRVLEVPGDTPILDIVRACGAAEQDTSAVLVGGFHGTWMRGANLRLGLSPAALAPFGGHPGAGILFVIGNDECGLRVTADILRYLAAESAQQCGPCMFGLPEMAGLLERIASGDPNQRLAGELAAISASVVGRGSCHHPNGTSRLVLNALDAFSADVRAHLTGRCIRTPGR